MESAARLVAIPSESGITGHAAGEPLLGHRWEFVLMIAGEFAAVTEELTAVTQKNRGSVEAVTRVSKVAPVG